MKYILFYLLLLSTNLYGNDTLIINSIDVAKQISTETNKPLLVIFGADYCVYCDIVKNDILNKKLSPNIDKYIICYVDIQKDKMSKEKYNISVIPDSIIIENNKTKSRQRGYNIEKYKKWLDND
jgi:thioredoxin-related protein